MAKGKELGIFWGNKNIYFVESIAQKPIQHFSIPFEEEDKTKLPDIQSIAENTAIPYNMKVASLIQNSMRHQKISTQTANLSLSTKDIIFRSFIIPWMPPNEVKGVVEFEVSKYIPFSLDELFFSYHPMIITQNNLKRLRIIFNGIKKVTLENYKHIIEQASIGINLVEPAPISIIRLLSFKKLLPKEQAAAIIQEEGDTGKITIVQKGIPQFVREFPLIKQEGDTPEDISQRLVNETRISLDYSLRQDKLLEVKQFKLISESFSEELAKYFETEIALPVALVKPSAALQSNSISEVGFMNAYGTGLSSSTPLPASFNLQSEPVKGLSLSSFSMPKALNYKSVIAALLICVPIIALSFLLPTISISKNKKELASVNAKLGKYKGSSKSKLKNQDQKLLKKYKIIKNIPTHSRINIYLETIPKLLPEGTWLSSLNIEYPSVSPSENETTQIPSVTIEGYAYLKNSQEQFGMINQFVSDLKNNKSFSESFNSIKLVTTESQTLNNYQVTFYKVVAN